MGNFQGPIFIIGMPRSGTKLLRSLLNNHSKIAITPYESGLIPYFYKRFPAYGDIKVRKNFQRFFKDFSSTTFYKRLNKSNSIINEELWFQAISDGSYTDVIKAFYGIHAQSQSKEIWGDKTPSYIYETRLLSTLFPEAKFIHIIRDVRDYSLSVNKAWNKSIFRASQRWKDAIEGCRKGFTNSGELSYLEIRYEDLIGQPESALESVCSFLNLPYEEGMNKLIKSPENLAATKGKTNIVTDNFGKWKSQMKPSAVSKIEQICGPLLKQLGYDVSSKEMKAKRLGNLELLFYKIHDALQVVFFEIRKGSLQNVYDSFRSIVSRQEK